MHEMMTTKTTMQGFQNKPVNASAPLAAWLLLWIELKENVNADLVWVQSSLLAEDYEIPAVFQGISKKIQDSKAGMFFTSFFFRTSYLLSQLKVNVYFHKISILCLSMEGIFYKIPLQ